MTSPSITAPRPDGNASRETVCCWCEPERVAEIEGSPKPAVRFGICRTCLEPRLRALRGLRESRPKPHVRVVS